MFHAWLSKLHLIVNGSRDQNICLLYLYWNSTTSLKALEVLLPCKVPFKYFSIFLFCSKLCWWLASNLISLGDFRGVFFLPSFLDCLHTEEKV